MSNQVIIHKKSAIADKKPTTEQLQYGELAINTHDGRLYTKVDDGVERVINLASKPAVASNTPPANPEDGSLWFDLNDASLNIYYDDGDSKQWISITETEIDLSDSSIGDLIDVDILTNTPANGQTIVWNGTKFVPGDVGTDLSESTTDDLAEGTINRYYTDARVQSVIDTNTAGFITDYTVTEADVTAHQSALTITESQISDLGTYATETYVDTAVSNLVDAAPETLDTLNELAAALGDDANFATTVTDSIALKANSADLSTVATSGDYGDLLNTPTIPAALTDLGITDGTNGQLLSTDGAGSFTFIDAPDTGVSVSFGTTAPSSPSAGDFWYNESVAEMFVYDGTNWITTADGVGDFFSEQTTDALIEGASNKYFTDARAQAVIDTNTAGFITDYTVTEADVTAHQAALSITESQISDLQSYLTDYTVTEADVTTHQAALSITESQISDLQSYLTSETNTSLAINANVLTYTDETGTGTDIDLSLYLDDSNLARLVSGTVDAETGVATFTRDDATTFTVDFSAFLDDTNLARIDTAAFNTDDGVLTLTRGADSSTVTVDLDGRFALASDVFSGDYTDLTNTPTIPAALTDLGINDGANGQLLSTDGSGNFTFIDAPETGSSVTSSDTAPSSPSTGDLWYDTSDATLNIYYTDADSSQWVVVADNEGLSNLSGLTSDDLDEGSTNLYYTDAKVQTVIDTNTAGFITATDIADFATETYVDTAVANLVDTAPTTLDTLNELAAALGDDPNFATTVTNSIGLKANTADLATVATSGDYSDLINTPTIPSELTDLSISDGTNGQLLSTDGSGNFTFIDAPATGVSVEFGTTAPSSPSSGDFWYNESIAELFVYDGTNWITTADGVGDFFSEQTTDSLIEGASNKYYTDDKVQTVIDTNTAGFITDYTVTETDVTTHQAALSITESQISDLQSYLTDYTVTEADVTAHQAALSITESQISDLGAYLTSSDLTGYATETYVDTAVSNLVDAAPATLDTLNELAAALGDDPNFATTVSNSIGLKANSADLATVATSGDYGDLLNTPTIPTNLSELTIDSDTDFGANKILYSNVYSNLVDLPSAASYHGMFAHVHGTGKAYYAHAGSWVELANTSEVFDGDYNSLTNAPTLFDGDYNSLTNTPTLFDGDYSSLINTPTIPSSLTDLSITDGTDGQLLSTDGSGNFTFVDAAGGGASVTVSADAPSSPSNGDLWYDLNDASLNIYYDDGTSSQWVDTGDGGGGSAEGGTSVTVSDTAPSSPDAGDLWYDTANVGLFVYIDDGTSAQWVETSTPPEASSGSVDFSAVDQSIIPDTDVAYDLGSPTKQWKDIYVGPGSLYVNGTKVLEDNNGTINVTADENQSIRVGTTGTGQTTIDSAAGVNVTATGSADITLTTATGQIELNGDVVVDVTKSITSSTGGAITFNAPISVGTNTITAQNFVGSFSGTIDDISNFTSDDLSEGSTNLYYTDAKVQTVIDNNTAGFATETYVDTAVSNLVDTAPETLDTLNELAAALGDDPNFATTVSNSIGLKANTADLATVATSGDYTDLINTPTIPTNLSDLTIDSDTDFGANKILYSNVYSTLGDLPSAASYHGMFAHVHGTGKAYYAHAGAWVELANTSEVFDGDYNSLSNTPTLFDGDYNSLTNTPAIPSAITDLGITDGTSEQVLSTDGSGNFTFVDAAGGGGASVTVSDTAPSSPSEGDLWLDSTVVKLFIYYDGFWVESTGSAGGGSAGGGASVEVSDTAPSSPSEGDLWYNTTTLDFYIYYSSNWVEAAGGGSGSSNTWTKQSTNYTAAAGDKLFVDTSSNSVTVTLPASPSMGDEIRIIDAEGNAATNNITIDRNGSNISGLSENLIININEAAFGLVYYNATRGWVLMEK